MPIYHDELFHNQVSPGVELLSIKNSVIDTDTGRISISRGDIFTVRKLSKSNFKSVEVQGSSTNFSASIDTLTTHFCKVLTHQEYAQNNYAKQFITNEELEGMDDYGIDLVEEEAELAEYYDVMQSKLNKAVNDAASEDFKSSSKLK
ncbi:hypothetical protein LIS04_03 [Listeria phage LIS04]|nr:hypothetical protein LIS04_03 [Listeria phage LIS04]